MTKTETTQHADSFDWPESPAAEQMPLEIVSSPSSLAVPSFEEDVEGQLALRNLEKRRKQKRRKRRIKIFATCAVVGGIVAVLAGRHFMQPEQPNEEYVPEVAMVERMDFENVITSSGALKAGSTVVVSPEVDGTIESVLVSEGQAVEQGDVLFTIKNDSLDKAVREAAQDVESAQQGVASAQRAVSDAQKSRDDAWSRYNAAWNEADQAYKEWQAAKNNYESLHAEWEARKEDADALACGAPQDPGKEPKEAGTEPVKDDYATDEEYEKAHDEWQRKKDAHDAWMVLLEQFQQDTKDYKEYQDALALVGDEPQPAGEKPEYPEKPDDTSLVSAIQDAKEGVTSANQAVEKAREAYDEAMKAAEMRQVKAPSAGNIVALNAKVGEAVGGGSDGGGSPLAKISDVSHMSMDIEVNEIDILSVKKGQSAEATFSAVSDVTCEAQVSEVATVATGEGDGGGIVTFHVGLIIPKPDAKLREGMTAKVKIYTAKVPNALVVPASAISEGAESTTVEVVTNEETYETETREVKVGVHNSSQAVIEEGLEEGEMVLLTGGSSDEFDEGFMG